MSVCSFAVCCLADLLSSSNERGLVKSLERVQCGKGFESALALCQEIIGRFEGSEETLRHIRRVEESLRRLTALGG